MAISRVLEHHARAPCAFFFPLMVCMLPPPTTFRMNSSLTSSLCLQQSCLRMFPQMLEENKLCTLLFPAISCIGVFLQVHKEKKLCTLLLQLVALRFRSYRVRKCSSWSLEFLLSSFGSQLWANSIVGLQWSLWIQTPSLNSYHTLRSTEEKHIWWIVSDFFLTMFDYPKPSHQHNKSAKSTRKLKNSPIYGSRISRELLSSW